MLKSWIARTCIASVLCLIVTPALAAGDPEAGFFKAQTCLGCHATPGYDNVYPTYKVPKLGGQHAIYIETALRAYASGERGHKTMHANAVSLSDQDIADIAAYISQPAER